MDAIRIEKETRLAAPPSAVWPLIIDTERMNRALGLASVSYTPVPPGFAGIARYLGETRLAGLRVAYQEHPFEWSFEREFSIYRACTSGPFEFIALRWTLEPEGSGTRLRVCIETKGARRVFQPIAHVAARTTAARIVELCEGLDEAVRNGTSVGFQAPTAAPAPGDALARCVERLRAGGVRPALASRVGDYVRDCSDADALSLRAFELADEWGEARRETLAAMLRAVPAGLLELRWSLLCPSCRTTSSEVTSLDQIGLEGHCQLCDISFELDLDRSVEATFHPHPSVRRVEPALFCIGGPARTPHVLSQVTLEPRGSATIVAPREPGRYRVFSRGGGRGTVAVDASAPTRAAVSVTDAKVEPADVSLAPGGELVVTNADDHGTHAKLEHLEYASRATTAHFVSTMDEFRGVFGADLLKRTTPLKVARVSLLFSDLTGSTALYALVGDAPAFRFVDDHFDVLRAVIGEHDGVVVKTMGDAVMASFSSDESCVRAAVECLRRFETFRKAAPHGDKTHIKLGLYSGPCYVISANGTTDYFGQTVNVASRLQHSAASGEVVMLEEEAAHLRAGSGKVSAVEHVRVKGVDHELRVVRVTL